MSIPFFPSAASTTAVETDHIYFLLLAFSVFVLALVFVPMLYFLYKYRRSARADRTPLDLPTELIEITWTVIPIFIALGFFACGARAYFREEVPPADTMEINVVGKQWMWKIQHQEGNRELNELHIPLGRAVKLTLASEDVIHSFYVPAFRIKQDVVPGRFTTEWFQAIKTGTYPFYCTEYCGMDHAKMQGTVTVMSPADYQAWLAHGAVRDSLAQSGESLFRSLGCSGCHAGNSPIHAPPLEGLYGRQVPLSDGTFVLADDQYLRDSILNPASQVATGYAPVMPNYSGRISEEDLLKLIAYIKSLAPETPPKTP
jgi:cytochrome c oxidase subunit II